MSNLSDIIHCYDQNYPKKKEELKASYRKCKRAFDPVVKIVLFCVLFVCMMRNVARHDYPLIFVNDLLRSSLLSVKKQTLFLSRDKTLHWTSFMENGWKNRF